MRVPKGDNENQFNWNDHQIRGLHLWSDYMEPVLAIQSSDIDHW